MKKLISFLILSLLVFALFGCTNTNISPTVQPEQVMETTVVNETTTVIETVAETSQQNTSDVQAVSDETIGEDKAKEIALSHAGLSESDVKLLFVELDMDDGLLRYEVDFRQGKFEYDYEIDAKTGTILSYDKDIDD